MNSLHPVARIEAHIAPTLRHFAEQQQRQLAPVTIAQQHVHMRNTPHIKHFGVRLDDPPQIFTHVWLVFLDVSAHLICRLQLMDRESAMSKVPMVPTDTSRLLRERRISSQSARPQKVEIFINVVLARIAYLDLGATRMISHVLCTVHDPSPFLRCEDT